MFFDTKANWPITGHFYPLKMGMLVTLRVSYSNCPPFHQKLIYRKWKESVQCSWKCLVSREMKEFKLWDHTCGYRPQFEFKPHFVLSITVFTSCKNRNSWSFQNFSSKSSCFAENKQSAWAPICINPTGCQSMEYGNCLTPLGNIDSCSPTLDLTQWLTTYDLWLVDCSVVSMAGKLVLWRRPLIS